MKTVFLSVPIIIIAFCIVSCTNSPGKTVDKGEKNSRPARNYSITSANSYSDLFLDSNTVEQFITRQHLTSNIADDMRSFYNVRNFEFAWFNSDGLTEQALAFRSLYDFDDSTDSKKILDRSLDTLMIADTLTIAATDASSVKTELLFTWRFINYITAKYADQSARQAALKELIPTKKQGTLAMAVAILATNGNEDITGESYTALRNQLKRYADASKSGGWQTLPLTKKKIKQHTSDPIIHLLKKRLQQTGELAAADTSNIFTPELITAIRKFQQEHGLKTDGAISETLIKQLNVPALQRTQQILINLERMRWMPSMAKGKTILVNIPEYILHVLDGDSSFNMDIVVGKEGHSTLMFTGTLDQVVFSPYWNLPPDIVRKEVLPSIKKNTHYLTQHDMEVTGEENGLPVIRQLPGDKNELGKVKFLFPNSFNIYFHDTPHKELFNNNERAFSHGCIRLREPAKMASFLLKDQPEWTPDKIDEAMNSGKEKFVKVKEPVPVLIYYYTAWIDDQHTLQWREDIYGHDEAIAKRLFSDAQ